MEPNNELNLKNLIPALIKFQQDCPDPKKDKVNPMFKSRYASIDSIVQTVKPFLAINDLAFTQSVSLEDSGAVVVVTTLYHKSGEWLDSVTKLKADKVTPQGAGSAFTYAKRYALSSLLGVSADEDDDGNAAEGDAKKFKPSTDVKVSGQDLTALVKLVNERGWTAQEVTQFIQAAFKIKSSSELSKKDYDILVRTIKAQNFNDAMEDLA